MASPVSFSLIVLSRHLSTIGSNKGIKRQDAYSTVTPPKFNYVSKRSEGIASTADLSRYKTLELTGVNGTYDLT